MFSYILMVHTGTVQIEQVLFRLHWWSDRICHVSQMQTETPQPEGKQIIPEKRFTEFQALSFDQRVGISLSESEIDE